MNVHISYKVPKSPDLEQQINLNIEKLRRRLQVFRPDLIHLHAIVEEAAARVGFDVRLDLRLPSGDIASRSKAKLVDAAIKNSFDDLLQQLGKHKERLRASHQWPNRRRAGKSHEVSQVPFEQTIAAVQPELVSDEDISTYVNANLPRLQRFVERELRFRENNGELRPHQLSGREVISEAIARALDHDDKPEKLALEPWLYRMALRAMQDLAHSSGDDIDSVHLGDLPRGENHLGHGSDEPLLQFHQPDESLTEENLIPDRGTATPEESAASDEMVGMIELALAGAKGEDREAFLLFGIEGFTVEEISAITARSGDKVRASIKTAREHLRKSLSVSAANTLQEKLLQSTRIA